MMREELHAILNEFDLENTTSIIELVNDLDEGLMIVDKDFKIIYYSSSMEEIESLKANEVIGKDFFDVFPDKSVVNSTVYQSLKKGAKIIDKIEEYLTYKGNTIKVINSTVPIIRQGKIIAALDINRNLCDLGKVMKSNKKGNAVGSNSFTRRKYSFDKIFTRSSRMLKAIDYGRRAAMQEAPVLLMGETGTGKELFAQSIHCEGIRRNGPFLAINCAAIPGDLIESILFGTEKGGFTGAVNRSGLFEQADGGTLMLDEINSMDLRLQAKILRVLQDGIFMRVGGKKMLKSNVRIVTTSNQDLMKLIGEGKFRSDLFYRLSVITIEIPPLRRRDNDTEFLTDHFLQEFSAKLNRTQCKIDKSVMEYFRQYDWPGNIRELRNVLEGLLCLIPEGDDITIGYLPEYMRAAGNEAKDEYTDDTPDADGTLRQQLEYYEKKIIINAIIRGGSISGAAALLGIKRQSLQYRMKKHNIKTDDFKRYYNPD